MAYALSLLPAFLESLKTTLAIFIWTLLGSIPLGIIVALGTVSKIKILTFLLDIYIWIMRGTPLLLQLIFVFYGLPLVDIVLDRSVAALVAFILNYTAYFAEIFRGGIQSIEQGQYESAQVLGMNYFQTVRKIIVPQVLKRVLPSIGNEVINLIKDTSLVYVLGMGDLLRAGKIAANRDVTLLPLILVGCIYLLLTFLLTMVFKQLEKRYHYYK